MLTDIAQIIQSCRSSWRCSVCSWRSNSNRQRSSWSRRGLKKWMLTFLLHQEVFQNLCRLMLPSSFGKDYLTQFTTFMGANCIPVEKTVQVFSTNQSTTTYKLLRTVAGQQDPLRALISCPWKASTPSWNSSTTPNVL